MPDRLHPVVALAAVPGAGHRRLTQADPAVVGRDAGMDEHPEAPALQPVDHSAQQQQVLEHASGEGHGGEAVGIAETDAGSTTAAVRPLWKRAAMVGTGTPAAMSSAAARTRSWPARRRGGPSCSAIG